MNPKNISRRVTIDMGDMDVSVNKFHDCAEVESATLYEVGVSYHDQQVGQPELCLRSLTDLMLLREALDMYIEELTQKPRKP